MVESLTTIRVVVLAVGFARCLRSISRYGSKAAMLLGWPAFLAVRTSAFTALLVAVFAIAHLTPLPPLAQEPVS